MLDCGEGFLILALIYNTVSFPTINMLIFLFLLLLRGLHHTYDFTSDVMLGEVLTVR